MQTDSQKFLTEHEKIIYLHLFVALSFQLILLQVGFQFYFCILGTVAVTSVVSEFQFFLFTARTAVTSFSWNLSIDRKMLHIAQYL